LLGIRLFCSVLTQRFVAEKNALSPLRALPQERPKLIT